MYARFPGSSLTAILHLDTSALRGNTFPFMISHVLDLYTLTVVLILVSASLSIVMLVAWRANKTYDGFGLWTAGNLLGSLAFLMVGLRDVIPTFVGIVGGNLLAIGSLLCIGHGVRVFFGRPLRIRLIFTALAAEFLFAAYYLLVDDNIVMRIVTVSVIAGIITAFSAYEFFTARRGASRFIHTVAGCVFAAFTIFMAGRAYLTYRYSNIDDLFAPDWIQSLSYLLFSLFVVIWTFCFTTLNSQRLQQDLEMAQVELERLATTDYLTGLGNSRAFFDRAASEVLRSQRYGIPLALVVFDIDHFKSVNDTFGHPGGDRTLREIAAACQRTTRKSDFIARLGGEEFGLLLAHADIESATQAAEHFRRTIEELIVEHEENTIFVTSSFGVAELRADDTLESLLARADSCLYRAKELGRNRVVTETADGDDRGYLDSIACLPSVSTSEHRV